MSIPKQAMEQLEKAEAALEEAMNPKDTSPVEKIVEIEEGNDESLLSQDESSAEEVSPQINEALERELELEKQRNASLKGRIDSQLKQANSENKELKSQLEEMRSQIEELSNTNKVPGAKRHISEKEAEELGEDVLNLQERVIKGTLEEELESGKIKELVNSLVEQSINSRTKVNTQQKSGVDLNAFWQTVEKYYPGARDINSSDTGWHSFLNLYDSKSGLKNRDVGANAINNAAVASLVDLLETYKPLGSVSVNKAKVSPKPETSGNAKAVNKQEVKPQFTQAGVELFFKDLADGKFKGKKGKAEAEKIEAQIMEAAQAGRIY